MKPSNEIIEEFRRIYFEEFGEEISKEEAYEKFLRLANFLRVVLRPPSEAGQGAQSSVFAALGIDQNSSNGKIENQN